MFFWVIMCFSRIFSLMNCVFLERGKWGLCGGYFIFLLNIDEEGEIIVEKLGGMLGFWEVECNKKLKMKLIENMCRWKEEWC